MVVEALAVGSIAILKQYLGKTGESFAKKVGEKLADKVGQLYQSIRNKFQTDQDAKKTLEGVEGDPTSAARVSALEGVLKDKLLHDEAFKNEVDRLVQDIKAADIHNQLVFGERNITVGGDANGVFGTGDGKEGKP